MLNCSASLAMSTSILKALPGKLDIKRHSPSILYIKSLRKPFLSTDCMYGDKALGCDHSSLCYTAEYVPLCCDLCQNAYTGIAGNPFINTFILYK